MLSNSDITTALEPQLDGLLDAVKVQPDERAALRQAALDLSDAIQRLLGEHDLDWRPDAALAVIEVACASEGQFEHAAAIHTIRDFHASVRAEQAKMN